MKTKSSSWIIILTVMVLTALNLPALAAPPPYYVAGDFNGWNAAGNLMTQTGPGSGIWQASLNMSVGRHEFKITQGSWSWSTPSSGNSWLYTDASGNVTITYDVNTYSDGWFSSSGRIGVNVDPTTWTAAGDWQGWNNADPGTAMPPEGGGIYGLQYFIASPGTYQYKAVDTGSWDAIGSDARSIDAYTLSFTTTYSNQPVVFSLNATNGTIKTDVLPPLPCIPTNANVKFCLLPQLTYPGLDVKDSRNNIILADDFQCTSSNAITDIHIWGSWWNDAVGTITNFTIGIYGDVPATTNLQGQIINSHPGQLLWVGNFPLGQYVWSLYTNNAYEYFYNPTNNTLNGNDHMVFYYCFFPTNPFVQRGSPSAPTNYWLAIRAQLPNDGTTNGWKSAATAYNDPAVWITTGGGMPGAGAAWHSMTNPLTGLPIHLSMVLTTTNLPPTPGWSVSLDENGNGIAVSNGVRYTLTGQLLPDPSGGLAGPVLIYTLPFVFPAGSVGDYQLFEPPNYTEVSDVVRFWGSPVGGGGNQVIFYSGLNAGEESPPVPLADTGLPGSYLPIVFPLNESGIEGGYQAATNSPLSGQPGYIGAGLVNYTFISDVTNATTVQCVETNGIKYVQWPNLFGGVDVWNSSTIPPQVTDGPWWLADDFVCTNTGPITDIHLWGSWQNDARLFNAITFQLYVLDDVPANVNLPWSHPGTNIIWHQTFAPGSYADTFWTSNAYEYFLDPGTPQILGNDFVVRYYCFYPTNLIQYGDPAMPKTYWLVAFAELPTNYTNVFGWKTTTNVLHDTSVHMPWTGYGVPPLNSLAWMPTYEYSGGNQPLDLAFKLTTPTNVTPTHWSVSLDENGNGIAVSGGITNYLTGQLLPDPSGGIAGNVLIYTLPFVFPAGSVGDYQMFEPPNYTEVSDVVRFWGSPVGGGGNQVVFYSGLDTGEEGPPVPLADTGLPGSYLPIVFPLNESGIEGGYQAATNSPLSGQPGYIGAGLVNYTFISDVTNATTPCCPETNTVKWVQPPNLFNGVDVDASSSPFDPCFGWGWYLADDFLCTNVGYIADIHIWGSWWNDAVDPDATFYLGIWSDVPTNAASPFSHPGNLLWAQSYTNGQYGMCFVTNISEPFEDGMGFALPACDNTYTYTMNLYHLCFPVPLPSNTNNTFYQLGTVTRKTNYWLSVTVVGNNFFGWKSSSTNYNDWAVASDNGGFPPANWNPIQNTNGSPLNMAFMIGMSTNQCTTPPQLQCSDLIVGCTNLTWLPPVPAIIDPCCPAGSGTLSMSGPFTVSNCPTVNKYFWSYTNCQGLTAFCSSYVTVTSAPPVLVPTNYFINCGSPMPTNAPGVIAPCCSNTVVPVWQYNLTNSGVCKLIITQYWKAVDCNCTNLYSTGTQTITVTDSNAPILIGCGTNMTVLWGNPWSFTVPTAQYVCSGSNAPVGILSSNVIILSSCSSSNIVVWSATNGCSGAYSTCTQVVTVTCTPCLESNGVKYIQWPNLNGGWDVWNNGMWMLADDFVCTDNGPISDIHIWGSWLGDNVGRNTLTFWLAIYDDVPVSPTNNYSHPGNLLWQQWFNPGQYAENISATGYENFLNPEPSVIMGPDSQVWYYCFYPKAPLFQNGSATTPKIYWLVAYAKPPTNNPVQYGWKTAQYIRNDISVHAAWPGMPPTNNPAWIPTHDPQNVPLDLAFKVTTDTNYNNIMKYIQWPNTTNGFDVWNSSTIPPSTPPGSGPWLLADDFACTNTGYITDIHLWGSWWYDHVLTNSITFWLGLFTDVPAVTNTGGQIIESHPGGLIWSQCFAPGQYSETLWSSATELFMDPGSAGILGSDSQVWYYSFFPTNPPIQWGSSITPRIYWVGAYAQMPPGPAVPNYYGWKTTTKVRNDISVHTPWIFGQCPTNIPPTVTWTSTHDNNNKPLDLAFEISTITNCSRAFLMIDKISATNVLVTWPSGILQWSTEVDRNYVDVPGAPTSPWLDTCFPPPPTNRFYRVRCD